MNHHGPLDRNGHRLNVGDRVRVIGVPDLSGMSASGMVEALPVFQHIVGSYKRIRAFDQFGCAELCFAIRLSDGERTWHSVWIEPFLLHLPQPKQGMLKVPNSKIPQDRRQ